MMNKNQKLQDEKKSGINPVVVAVTGAVVGAGVSVAGAMALKNGQNRNKIKEVLTNVRNQAIDYIEDMQRLYGNRAETSAI